MSEALDGDATVAVLGAGKLGEALLGGLIRAGRDRARLLVTTRRPEHAQHLQDRHDVQAVSNADAAARADVVLIAVKPQDIGPLLEEIATAVTAHTLVVSLAAGVTTARIEAALPDGVAVVRVMTNTPVLVDEAMSVMSAGTHAGDRHLDATEALLRSVGHVLRVPESQQDAVTALSGSGPAYFYYLVEAMTEAGILVGLPRSVARHLVVQTAVGAAAMLRDSGEHPVRLREAVTSPAGTTVNAIRELDKHTVRAAVWAAVEAARDRSVELGEGPAAGR